MRNKRGVTYVFRDVTRILCIELSDMRGIVISLGIFISGTPADRFIHTHIYTHSYMTEMWELAETALYGRSSEEEVRR